MKDKRKLKTLQVFCKTGKVSDTVKIMKMSHHTVSKILNNYHPFLKELRADERDVLQQRELKKGRPSPRKEKVSKKIIKLFKDGYNGKEIIEKLGEDKYYVYRQINKYKQYKKQRKKEKKNDTRTKNRKNDGKLGRTDRRNREVFQVKQKDVESSKENRQHHSTISAIADRIRA